MMTIGAAFDLLRKEYGHITLQQYMTKPRVMHIPSELITEKFRGEPRYDTAGTLIEPGDVVAFPGGPQTLNYAIVVGYTKQGYRLWQFHKDRGRYTSTNIWNLSPGDHTSSMDVAVVKKVGYEKL
ncbi:hypothetical protein [Serratia phage SP1]|nr:hypothetical protein [Serratia phage SP1]